MTHAFQRSFHISIIHELDISEPWLGHNWGKKREKKHHATFAKKVLEVPSGLEFWILQVNSTTLSWYCSILNI